MVIPIFFVVVFFILLNPSLSSRLMTLPDIDCVELLYENYPSDFYFLPCELADNTEQLIYEKRFENGFDDVYSNNLCQRVREYNQADGYLELSITKSNMFSLKAFFNIWYCSRLKSFPLCLSI